MSGSIQVSYDTLPYSSQFFAYTHPDRMATMARLHGLTAPPVERCRVLELGCSTGVNLLAIAQSLPEARLVGIDLSPRQVADGRAWIERLGLTNVELRVLDLMDVDEALGPFDYVICHGVYSWVPAAARDRILEICRRVLAPDGIAYISYNTYPGWHLRGMVREMLVFHTREFADPRERTMHARAFLSFLVKEATPADGAYARALRDESELLAEEDDSYLLHEHLDEVNHPLYFHEFVAHAESSGLRYLAPAQFSARDTHLPPEVMEALDRLGTDRIRREQYLDFVRDRTFRQSLLCHADRTVLPEPTLGAVPSLRLVALASPASDRPDVRSDAAESFVSQTSGRLTTNQPLVKAALTILHESWPHSLTFDELRGEVAARLGRPMDEPHTLAEAMLRCYRSMVVQLHVHEPPIAFEPDERPRAAPLARLQAEGDTLVISLRNRNVELDTFDTLLLQLLDGTRDRAALVERLTQWVAEGTFEIHDEAGRLLQDPSRVRAALAEAIEPSLRLLARQALLCRTPDAESGRTTPL